MHVSSQSGSETRSTGNEGTMDGVRYQRCALMLDSSRSSFHSAQTRGVSSAGKHCTHNVNNVNKWRGAVAQAVGDPDTRRTPIRPSGCLPPALAARRLHSCRRGLMSWRSHVAHAEAFWMTLVLPETWTTVNEPPTVFLLVQDPVSVVALLSCLLQFLRCRMTTAAFPRRELTLDSSACLE